MSASWNETGPKDYSQDGRTKQAFKDQTDINKLLARAARGDTISHLAKHGAVYGDFSDIDDLMTAQARLAKGVEIFQALPAEIKREFNQSPAEFFNFVNNPENEEKLPEVLPALAARGQQFVSPRRTAATVAVDDQIAADNAATSGPPSPENAAPSAPESPSPSS